MPNPVTPFEVARRELGFTQETVAENSGLAVHTIRRVERGELPQLRTAFRLAETLGVALERIFPAPPSDATNDDEVPTKDLADDSEVSHDRARISTAA